MSRWGEAWRHANCGNRHPATGSHPQGGTTVTVDYSLAGRVGMCRAGLGGVSSREVRERVGSKSDVTSPLETDLLMVLFEQMNSETVPTVYVPQVDHHSTHAVSQSRWHTTWPPFHPLTLLPQQQGWARSAEGVAGGCSRAEMKNGRSPLAVSCAQQEGYERTRHASGGRSQWARGWSSQRRWKPAAAMVRG